MFWLCDVYMLVEMPMRIDILIFFFFLRLFFWCLRVNIFASWKLQVMKFNGCETSFDISLLKKSYQKFTSHVDTSVLISSTSFMYVLCSKVLNENYVRRSSYITTWKSYILKLPRKWNVLHTIVHCSNSYNSSPMCWSPSLHIHIPKKLFCCLREKFCC